MGDVLQGSLPGLTGTAQTKNDRRPGKTFHAVLAAQGPLLHSLRGWGRSCVTTQRSCTNPVTSPLLEMTLSFTPNCAVHTPWGPASYLATVQIVWLALASRTSATWRRC